MKNYASFHPFAFSSFAPTSGEAWNKKQTQKHLSHHHAEPFFISFIPYKIILEVTSKASLYFPNP